MATSAENQPKELIRYHYQANADRNATTGPIQLQQKRRNSDLSFEPHLNETGMRSNSMHDVGSFGTKFAQDCTERFCGSRSSVVCCGCWQIKDFAYQ
eukprot:1131437-Amphidinium_carterae.1